MFIAVSPFYRPTIRTMRLFRRFRGDGEARDGPREIRLWGVKVATLGVAEYGPGGRPQEGADAALMRLIAERATGDAETVELEGADAVKFVELLAARIRRDVEDAEASALRGDKCVEARRRMLEVAEKSVALLSRLGDVKADMLADYILGAGEGREAERVEQAMAVLRRLATAAWAALARVEYRCTRDA